MHLTRCSNDSAASNASNDLAKDTENELLKISDWIEKCKHLFKKFKIDDIKIDPNPEIRYSNKNNIQKSNLENN